jgi:hypothetical protein
LSALHWVTVDVTKLLDLPLFGPYVDVEIVKALLPDRRAVGMDAGPFSSQTSVTIIADTQSRSRNNSPTVQHRELRPSPETDPSFAAKPFSAAL